MSLLREIRLFWLSGGLGWSPVLSSFCGRKARLDLADKQTGNEAFGRNVRQALGSSENIIPRGTSNSHLRERLELLLNSTHLITVTKKEVIKLIRLNFELGRTQ